MVLLWSLDGEVLGFVGIESQPIDVNNKTLLEIITKVYN